MKVLLVIAACIAVAVARKSRRLSNTVALQETTNPWGFTGSTFDQCIDHFDKSDPSPNCTNTFQQRYWSSNQFYQKGGPVFVFTGGEGNAEDWTTSGQWLLYGYPLNAYFIVMEHRFYGKSYPKPSSDRSSATMKLLSSQQALQDYAKLLRWFIKQNNLTDSKVVVVGSSYPGSIAAWFRQSFPDIANIAIVSSGPLKFQAEFPEFIDVSAMAIKEANPACFNKIQSTFECIEALVNGTTCAKGVTKLNSTSGLSNALGQCWDYQFDDAVSKGSFFTKIGREIWASNYPGTESASPCKTLLAQDTTDLITGYGNFLRAIGKGQDCSRRRRKARRDNDEFYSIATADDDNSDSSDNYQRSWVWQTCNEFGAFQVSDKNLHMLGYNTISNVYPLENCKIRFPDTKWTMAMIRNNVAATNARYNGRNYSGTCVIFTQGTWDPWRVMGIYKQSQTSKSNKVFLIQNGEHTEDMNGPSSNPWAKDNTTAVQDEVKAQLKRYLMDPKC